jgi:spore coat polysaccharide biosynthesis protein SpsF
MKTGAIIQARMSSERLPGKVLNELPYGSGISSLEQIVYRLQQVESIHDVIIATSTNEEDKAIVDMADSKGIHVYTGSLNNVLERFTFAARSFHFDHVVRITGDCPCIDPVIIEETIQKHLQEEADFTTTGALKRTFPVGMDAAVIKMQALEEAYQNADNEYEKEHVTPYIYKSNPKKFKIVSVEASEELADPTLRVTMDTPEDYLLLCSIYDALYSKNQSFGLREILTLLEHKPWLRKINEKSQHKKIHSSLESELNEVIEYCEKQDLKRARSFIVNKLRENNSIGT